MLAWLLMAGVGPAAAALPVNWLAGALTDAATRWFKRIRRTDDLSRLVLAASPQSAGLSDAEFGALRRLLEDQEMWTRLGECSVADLMARIATCVPPRDGRTAAQSGQAAEAIARGLLEFVVADLEPAMFQRVLLARLNRLETSQASALDLAMLDLNAEIAAGFGEVLGLLRAALDRLPPGSATRAEIVVYLRTLIEWLGSDRWPQDRRLAGPALTPAAIERKLRLASRPWAGDSGQDADELAGQCRRLVILGGPGSGKTWLAKRTARRCAEAALAALVDGGTIDEVELPLYTTCSRLFGAPGDIRDAVSSSAINQIGDLGGVRLSSALRSFFADRNSPTLLVIDSLDEAHGSDESLRSADKLPWRIMLTSRPSSWNNQLDIRPGDESHMVGQLLPLRYPQDVEPFIRRWFEQRPEWGEDLAEQVAQRPSLQQAVTVPLILAFCCIVGGSSPLPDYRRDLYAKVLNRLLSGLWRGSGGALPDTIVCTQALRTWAWRGSTSDPVSGTGAWADDILVEPLTVAAVDQDALDHVAGPTGPRDLDSQLTPRRFIHRSIREHLVAEHVASLPTAEAADVLLPHLWFDPDWEYATAAAIAMHPDRDVLLRALAQRAAGQDHLPADLAAIDAGQEFTDLLAMLATESREADWSSEMAERIGEVRTARAIAPDEADLGGAGLWETSDTRAIDELLDLLAGSVLAEWHIVRLVRLSCSPDNARRVRARLLTMLANPANAPLNPRLAWGLMRLGAPEDEQRAAREILLDLLAAKTDSVAAVMDGLTRLEPTADDMQRARSALLGLLAGRTAGRDAAGPARCLTSLGMAPAEARRGYEALLRLLRGERDPKVSGLLLESVERMASEPEDRDRVRAELLRLITGAADPWAAAELLAGMLRLDPTPHERRAMRQLLPALLAGASNINLARPLVKIFELLAQADEDESETRQALLGLLAGTTEWMVAVDLAAAVLNLDPPPGDRRKARELLLATMARETYEGGVESCADLATALCDSPGDRRQVRDALLAMLAGSTTINAAPVLSDRIARLDPTDEQRAQAWAALLHEFERDNGRADPEDLAGALAGLHPPADVRQRARDALVRLMGRQTHHWEFDPLLRGFAALCADGDDRRSARAALLELVAARQSWQADLMASTVLAAAIKLAPAPQDKVQVRQAVLARLATEDDGRVADHLAYALTLCEPTAGELSEARQAMLRLLTSQPGGPTGRELVGGHYMGVVQVTSTAAGIVRGLTRLHPDQDGLREAREALLGYLDVQADGRVAAEMAAAMLVLAPQPQDRHRALGTLLGLLPASPGAGYQLADAIVKLCESAQHKHIARDGLIAFLAGGAERQDAQWMVPALAKLDPQMSDLRTSRTWARPPSRELLAAVRRNTRPEHWLAGLATIPSA